MSRMVRVTAGFDVNSILCGPKPDELPLPVPTQTRRVVRYNQHAVLCSGCQKRIRLNNNGLLRVHVAARQGSERCLGSGKNPFDVL